QDRKSIVLSRKATGRTETLAFVSDFKGACQEARRLGGRAAIIGGGEIYRLFLPHALRVHMTTVYMDVSGDTTFPTLTGQWRCAEWESAARRDVRDEFLSSYQVYERVSVQH
ncbi:MAG: dihydrofolate reductase, partial [Patescibacteria group bacterium]|nr:dihydrofolate reductase [Patescibacteria group bacterium]